MTTPQTPTTPVPRGYGTVTPWIMSRDTAQLLDFVARAFDATELARVHNDDGTIGHAEVRTAIRS
jgi:PhnB protein